jgi:hypothetical protein
MYIKTVKKNFDFLIKKLLNFKKKLELIKKIIIIKNSNSFLEKIEKKIAKNKNLYSKNENFFYH